MFLIKLPAYKDILQIENELMLVFDSKIQEAIFLSEDYLDFTKEKTSFTYTDGNDLYKKSGAVVSRKIAN
ncbi:hypothetical protein [Aureispira sp. CCB-E]|uniref:hypothetical protein n=1 Tax=Aureispira sp. CCB-E TaxID=3051121 RepID=UPI00286967B7|nr:hypothetical protein [Aureispira sp. CCB-E]WMX16013.1 hypothetical protein QP953_06500 [Aureispira sp. CCB-E]